MSVRILVGDVRERLAELPDDSVHCVVTSPPYYGLRDYGVDGQIGLEPTLTAYIETMVDVFREVRRVLRSDGVCWLNIGDSYAGGPNGNIGRNDADRNFTGGGGNKLGSGNPGQQGTIRKDSGLKPKDLMMVPARLALALQADGWWLRSDIIWHKPNPMPESVTDRPTNAHEHIFLLTKSARYWYDADAVREPLKNPDAVYKTPDGWDTSSGDGGHGSFHKNGREKGTRADKQRGHGRRHAGFNDRWDAAEQDGHIPNGANLRNVWSISTQGFPGAHFATFPEELVRTCIKAGCPADGTVLDPFGGSGTTGLVADQLGRDAILIELNPAYASMAEDRIRAAAPMFAEVSA